MNSDNMFQDNFNTNGLFTEKNNQLYGSTEEKNAPVYGQAVNQFAFPSAYGEKRIELHQGDIMHFGKKAEVLVVSAYEGDYVPTSTSLIGALKRSTGISVEKLSRSPMIDLGREAGVWVSHRLEHGPFSYLVCLELVAFSRSSRTTMEEKRKNREMISSRIRNLFLALEMLDKLLEGNASVIMPLIGSGNQRIQPSLILDSLLGFGKTSLQHCNALTNIYIVEYNAGKIPAISQAMNEVLGRDGSDLLDIVIDPESERLIADIRQNLMLIQEQNPGLYNTNAFREMSDLLVHPETASFSSLAIDGRKVLEIVLRHLTNADDCDTLSVMIVKLQNTRYFAEWITTYMHLIRSIGNNGAHSEISLNNVEMNLEPLKYHLTENDQKVLLYALDEVLKYCKLFLRTNGDGSKIDLYKSEKNRQFAGKRREKQYKGKKFKEIPAKDS